MRATWPLLIGAGIAAGCVASDETAVTPRPASLLLVRYDPDHHRAIEIIAVEGDEARIFRNTGVGDLYVLAYDASLAALGVTVDPDHRVAVAPAESTERRAWPLPAPARWGRAQAGETTFESGPLPPDLAAIMIDRPPCPTIGRTIVPFDVSRNVVGLMPLGRGNRVLATVTATINRKLDTYRPEAVFVIDPAGDAREVPPPALLSREAAFHVSPLLYDDGRGVRLLWGNELVPGQRASARTFAVNDDVTYGDERPVVQSDGEAAPADKIVGRGDTTLYHRYLHQVWAARTATAVLQKYADDGNDVAAPCGLGTYTQVLEMHTPTTGLIAMVGAPIRRFDLDAPGFFTEPFGPDEAAHVCRSAHVVFDSGDEILAWQPPRDDMIEAREGDVVWRRTPQDRWQSLERPVPPVSSCGFRYKDLAFICVSDRRHLGVYQRDGRRPELRPRYCGEIEVSPDVTHGAETDAGVLVGGGLGLMWLVPSE